MRVRLRVLFIDATDAASLPRSSTNTNTMSFASQREKLLTAVREIAEKKERRDRERAVASASEPSISNSNEDKERKKLAKEEKERKRELEKQIREQRREKKAKEREERKEEKRYTKGQGAPAPKSDALLLGDLLLDDYDAVSYRFERSTTQHNATQRSTTNPISFWHMIRYLMRSDGMEWGMVRASHSLARSLD